MHLGSVRRFEKVIPCLPASWIHQAPEDRLKRAGSRRRRGPSPLRQPLRGQQASLRGDAEGGVHGAVTGVSSAALDDLEEEAVAEGAAVDLEIFSLVVAVVEDARGSQLVGKIRLQPEAGLQVVI